MYAGRAPPIRAHTLCQKPDMSRNMDACGSRSRRRYASGSVIVVVIVVPPGDPNTWLGACRGDGALLAFFETAGAGAETGGAGSSAVWMRGAAAGTAFGAEGAASAGLDDGTGRGTGKLGPAMTTTVRGDALTGITTRPPTSPAAIAAKPPIIKRSMVRLSSSRAQRPHRRGGMVNGSSPGNIDRRVTA